MGYFSFLVSDKLFRVFAWNMFAENLVDDLLEEEDEEEEWEGEEEGEVVVERERAKEEYIPDHQREEELATPCPAHPEPEEMSRRETSQKGAAEPRERDGGM